MHRYWGLEKLINDAPSGLNVCFLDYPDAKA